MPRNRSEKLASIPEAHAYADACEGWLEAEDTKAYEGQMPVHFSVLWNRIPWAICDQICGAVGRLGDSNEHLWRRRVVNFVRENYAP